MHLLQEGEYENPDRTRPKVDSPSKQDYTYYTYFTVIWSPIALIHYPPCSNLVKNMIVMNEEHELSTVQ